MNWKYTVESLQHSQSFTQLQEQKLGPWRYKGEVMVDPSYRIEHLAGDWWMSLLLGDFLLK